jgi:cytochrome c peroxidase
MRKVAGFLLIITFIGTLFNSCRKESNPNNKWFDIYNDTLPEFNPVPFLLERKLTMPEFNIRPDNPLTEQGVMLGRMLFYDPILSSDSTQSCASCHNQAFAFTDDGKKFSVGAVGTRNSMALYNLQWHPNFFWDGRSPNIRDQVIRPIEDPTEMNSSIEEALDKLQKSRFYRLKFYEAFGTNQVSQDLFAKAMEQFLYSMISFESPFDKWRRGDFSAMSESAMRGMEIFFAEPSEGGADCFHCHGGIHFADFSMANNGLDTVFKDLGRGAVTGNSLDNGKFKVVSLRNIAKSAPYFHDGRFATLRDVIDFYSEGVHPNSPNIDPKMDEIPHGLFLSEQQKSDLISFLEALTDQEFLTNPGFSNPFD